MSAKIWDAQAQAFKDAETPKVYDVQAQAWRDSTGMAYNQTAQAWQEVWSPQEDILYLYKNGVEYNGGVSGYSAVVPGQNQTAGAIIQEYNKMTILSHSCNVTDGVCSNQPIDLTHYNKLCAEVLIDSIMSNDYGMSLNVIKNRVFGAMWTDEHGSNMQHYGSRYVMVNMKETGKIVKLEADVSNLALSAYITVNQYCVMAGCIYAIWLES